jgi:hypothetical protein
MPIARTKSFTRAILVSAFAFASITTNIARADESAESRFGDGAAGWQSRDPSCRSPLVGDSFARTELYFGLSKPTGEVSDAQFREFVDNSVTPRFPDGLTLVKGDGQFRDSKGTTIREKSRLLILFYSLKDKGASERVEAIRLDYRNAFQQESVLRVDSRSCVSF